MPLTEAMRARTIQAIQEAELPTDFLTQVEQFYLPLAEYINAQTRDLNMAYLLSLQGPQGAGKSTLCAFLQLILEYEFGHSVAVLSLDDFYYPATKRQQLANEVHPLLRTRGVPGTHDLNLAVNTLQELVNQEATPLPRFNKADDNPIDQLHWPVSQKNTSIILFEGWCNHVPVQSEDELNVPINELELNEDGDGIWRRYVNDQLAIYHEQLFCMADGLLYLKIPDFQLVYDWRGLQEQKLKSSATTGSAIMDSTALKRFIQHFERLTRHGMKHLPHLADACLHLNKQHKITALDLKKPS